MSATGGKLPFVIALQTHPEPDYRFGGPGDQRVDKSPPPTGSCCRTIMMLLLFYDDPAQRLCCRLIDLVQRADLLMHVSEDHALDRDRGSGNGVSAGQSSHKTEEKSARRAECVASTAWLVPAMQLGFELRSVTPLMCEELVELRHHLGRSPSGKPTLGPVYADCAMLPRVVHFHDTIAQRLSLFKPRDQNHALNVP
jgi:hypothetical protein